MSNPKFHIMINAQAGTVKAMGVDVIEQKVVDSGIGVESLHVVDPDQMFERMVRLKESKHPILVGGGDGTIRSCAAIALKHGIEFGIIPLGTMNLLGRDLKIPTNIEAALGQYKRGFVQQNIDVGFVNDQLFLCCAAIGTMPEASHFREQNRDENFLLFIPQLGQFLMQKMDRHEHLKLSVEIDNKPYKLKTAMFVVSNNQYKSEPNIGADNFNREALDDGLLGAYSVSPQNFWDKVRLLSRFFVGDWKKDAQIREWTAQRVMIKTGQNAQDISLDGEIVKLQLPLEFSIRKKSLSIVTPQHKSVG